MSSQNAFPGPNTGRPAARPANPERPRQPSWVNPQAKRRSRRIMFARLATAAGATPSGRLRAAGLRRAERRRRAGRIMVSGANCSRFRRPAGAAGSCADPYAPQFEPYVPTTAPAYGASAADAGLGASANAGSGLSAVAGPRRPARLRGRRYDRPGHAGPQAMPQQSSWRGAIASRPIRSRSSVTRDWPPGQRWRLRAGSLQPAGRRRVGLRAARGRRT